VRVSVVYYPHDDAAEALAVAEAADRLGFHGWYLTDSTYRKDLYMLMAAAALRTSRVRIGPSAIRLLLTDPLVAARALATLDELSGGRVDAVLGLGDARFGGTQGAEPVKPVPFLRESFDIIRRALEQDRISYEGRYFSYDYRDMPMRARPVQARIPLWFGSGGGPRLLSLSAEIADGMHLAPGHTRRTCEYAVDLLRQGAERAGRDHRELDFAMGPVFVCAEDGDLAREVARIHSTFYLPFQAPAYFEQINDRGLAYSLIEEIAAAWKSGDLRRASDLVPHELASMYYVAGTPEECVATLRENIEGTDVNHLVLMIADSGHVEMIRGEPLDGVPTVREQMELIGERVMPALW
jgi:5,10-methylenetetrahydromethanopterin reductase